MYGQLFVFIFAIFLLFLWTVRKPKNLPPGEWGLPIVGYIPFMSWKLSKTLMNLQKKHGDIFTIKVGSKTWVVLTDFDVIKSAFQKVLFSGRPIFYQYIVLKKINHKGIILSNGKIWETSRRFALRTLRDFGFGKSSFLDEIIYNEAHSLIENLKEKVNLPTEIQWEVNVAIFNIIWKLVANKRYEISDKEVQKFSKDLSDNIVDCEGKMALLTLFPKVVPFVPNYIKNRWMLVDTVEKRRDEMLRMLENVIEEHKRNLDPKNPKDFIDKYLIELEAQKDNPDYQYWGDDDLLLHVYDFFLAGTETTSSTIRWFFLYMAKNQEIQKKVQKQIDENISKGEQVSLHDKDRLPLLEALNFEFPNAIPHEVMEDTVLEGYNIPKGTWIIPDVESCHRNPKYWKLPNEFSLENFLDEDGKVIRNKDGYLPFSLGKRVCVGESLAKMELFVFFGAILQNFEISEPVGENASLEPNPNPRY
ncbi:cytochrome P450 2L1 [Armadillidium vulgare]|nr:cytochrome P450 2L1 [Armadillidium vulgare]